MPLTCKVKSEDLASTFMNSPIEVGLMQPEPEQAMRMDVVIAFVALFLRTETDQ